MNCQRLLNNEQCFNYYIIIYLALAYSRDNYSCNILVQTSRIEVQLILSYSFNLLRDDCCVVCCS